MRKIISLFISSLLFLAACINLAAAADNISGTNKIYDPLIVSEKFIPEIIDVNVIDTGRNREIPIKIYLPEVKEKAPVVIFSHGLGGSKEGNAYLGKHWSARGYAAVFIQHPGSDTSVWKDSPRFKRYGALKNAASLENFMLRVKDVPAVLDKLEFWNTSKQSKLYNRLDMTKVGMSGHSFGAVTTQAVSGEKFIMGQDYTDNRIKAALAFSPSVPKIGDPKKIFGSVKIPWMLMTGTKDTGVIVNELTPESRLGVYPALPPGGKYELVLYNAEHSAFADRSLPGDKQKRNPNHHRAILALSTAFWDTYLAGNKDALNWLDGGGPKTILEKDDKWQHK